MSDVLGEFEQMVLLAVMRLGDGAYGLAILDELEHTAERKASTGALYTTLDRLEQKGLIVSRAGERSDARGGRPRRYVDVTAQGQDALARSRARLLALWDGLEEALGQ